MQHSDTAGSVLPLPSALIASDAFFKQTCRRFSKHVIVEQPTSRVMSSSDSLILSSPRVKRLAGQEGNTARTAPNVSSTFQRHRLVTRETLQFLGSNSIFNITEL